VGDEAFNSLKWTVLDSDGMIAVDCSEVWSVGFSCECSSSFGVWLLWCGWLHISVSTIQSLLF